MSAKTQKLFLNPPDADGFCDYALAEASPRLAPTAFQAAAGGAAGTSFGLPEVFWNWVKEDPEVNQQFEALIAAKVEERLETLRASALAEAQAKGKAEGLEQGRLAAQAELKDQKAALQGIGQALLRDKATLLLDHEALWVAALGHVLKRFLVPERELALAEIDGWLKDSLSSFEQKGKIRLHLCDADYRRLEEMLHELPKSNWELVRDTNLIAGEVRCETNAGGILFSSEQEMKHLFDRIEGRLAKRAA